MNAPVLVPIRFTNRRFALARFERLHRLELEIALYLAFGVRP